jgi:hypothetical protein
MRAKYFCVMACCVIGLSVLDGSTTRAEKEKTDFIRVKPSDVQWHDIPGAHGAQEAILFGNPDKPGMYVVRVKFPPHIMDRPHLHPNDRFATVLEGNVVRGHWGYFRSGPGGSAQAG